MVVGGDEMANKRKLVGTVKVARALGNMTKFLTLPVETAPRKGNVVHALTYNEVTARFNDTVDVEDSDVELIDA